MCTKLATPHKLRVSDHCTTKWMDNTLCILYHNFSSQAVQYTVEPLTIEKKLSIKDTLRVPSLSY